MSKAVEENYPAIDSWRCDTCGKQVSVQEGYVIWNSNGPDRDFRIIHKSRCDDKDLSSSMALSDLVGADGIATLLSFLTVGSLAYVPDGLSGDKEINLTDFADLFRRLHVPNYERARRHFGDPRIRDFVGGWNERAMYMPEELADIAAVGEAKRDD
ncbi:hypothetical protein [Dyella sp.]|uniref:hypothetical protein n=1 Tax=Dyella sp. TaxID=1869338 RepID=UPI002B4670FF|nr:hypothetical protein [Dyella sp.]HKT29160.1 hypothetical protein [Dyella sp.]